MNTTTPDMCILVTVAEIKADGLWESFKKAKMRRDARLKPADFDCLNGYEQKVFRIDPVMAREIGYTPTQDEVCLR